MRLLITSSANLDEPCSRLLQVAGAAGSVDDISVLLARESFNANPLISGLSYDCTAS
jgi:hypothetical protein